MSEFLGTPVDPLDGPTFALGGRVVTMDAHDSVVTDGVVSVVTEAWSPGLEESLAGRHGRVQVEPLNLEAAFVELTAGHAPETEAP